MRTGEAFGLGVLLGLGLLIGAVCLAGCTREPTPPPPVMGERGAVVRGPNRPTHLTAVVADRRKTSFQLRWVAPSDSKGRPIAGYTVYVMRQCTCTPIILDGGVDGGSSCEGCTPIILDGGVDGGSSCCLPAGSSMAAAIDAGQACTASYTNVPATPGQPDGVLVERIYCP